MALTKRSVDSAAYEGNGSSRDIRWDGDRGVPGFGVRIYPSGRKSFVLQYRTRRGRVRLLTLGKHGVLTVEQARQKARRALVEAEEGGDPLDARTAQERDLTVREFSDLYIERHAKPNKRTWREDERRLRKYVLPRLGSRPLIDVTRALVSRFHAEIAKSAPIEANRVLTLVGILFSRAEEWGYVPEGHPNPSRKVRRSRESSRDRWLSELEVNRLLRAVSEESDVYFRAAVLLYLLTGVRKSELLSARWDDVDYERKVLRLPNTKSGRAHEIPLSRAALKVMAELPRELGSPWVFPGADGSHRKDFKRAWDRVRAHAELRDVRVHDLRRTVGSWMAQAGVPLQVIGDVLNHTHPSVTRVYARLADDQRRQALEFLGNKLLEGTSSSTPQLPRSGTP